MTPDEYCANKAASSGSSFYYSFRFLPAHRRRAITALYAFCREVDDIVDDCSEQEIATVKLGWWREEIDRLFDGTPQHPVTRALAVSREQFDIHREYLLEIIDGMQMDVEYDAYPTIAELRLYCHRVAGVVGLLSAEIFGYQERSTRKYASELGLALQLINILRDVREDAERGRVYIPQDELRDFGVAPQELLVGQTSDAARSLFRHQAERAREAYRHAREMLSDVDRENQLPGLIMGRIYVALLDEIEADGFRVLEHRTELTPLRKLWIAWRTARIERRRPLT